MTSADRDRRRAVTSRLVMVVVLGAVVLGIVGMHSLVAAPDAGEHVGHHAVSATVLTSDFPAGAPAGSDTPADDAGLLALCLMVLTPGLALGLWLLASAALGGGWRPPRPVVRVVTAVETAALPPPFQRSLSVLRI